MNCGNMTVHALVNYGNTTFNALMNYGNMAPYSTVALHTFSMQLHQSHRIIIYDIIRHICGHKSVHLMNYS